MKIDDLKLCTNAVNAALALALKIELHGKSRYRPTRRVEDLVAMLKEAKRHEHAEIRTALEQLIATLTKDQLGKLWAQGVDLVTRNVAPTA
ncbi:hypothetical protein [Geopseudomonas aromaticivorans]